MSADKKLIPNNSKYWEFIRQLRFDQNNIQGFVATEVISQEQQRKYMEKYNDNYCICLLNETPVGFIGEVEGDIRLAVLPSVKREGVGKFMLSEFIKLYPHCTGKVKKDNLASINLFHKCNFKQTDIDSNFVYFKYIQ